MIRLPITIALAVLTGLGSIPTAARLYGDHGHASLAVLAVTTPFAMLGLIVLLALQAVTRRKVTAAVTAAVVILNVGWLVPLYVGDGHPRGQALNTMTTNLRYGEADPFTIVRLVKANDVAVFAAQELTDAEVTDLRGAGLDKLLPYSDTATKSYGPDGSGLWSRYPITDLPEWSTRFRSPGAVVHAPGHDVTVRVVHAYPPVGNERGVWRKDTALLVKSIRALSTSGPTIVLGDLNATPDNSIVRDIEGDHFRDASEEAGSGYLRTWGVHPGSTGFLDLDHIFVDRSIGAVGTSVYDVPKTDHNALVARLVLVAGGR